MEGSDLAVQADIPALPAGAAAHAIAPPLAHRNIIINHDCSTSDVGNNSSFVKAIDRKARGCLKTLIERRLSFSAASPDQSEDPSTTTIEFLQARLQAQRAEYKAEKQRAQQLAKKVLELEQRLKLEVERRKKMANLTPIDNKTSDASSCNHCMGSGKRFIARKNEEGHLPSTISNQCSTSKLKRIISSHSFPDMKATYNPACEHRAEPSSARSNIIYQPRTRTASIVSIDEDGDFITECSTGKDTQAAKSIV